MRATLVFYDTRLESSNGSLRSIIGYLSILTLYYILHQLDKKLFTMDNKILITAVLFTACLGVLEPKSINGASVLGGLVGLVLFTIIAVHNPTINRSNINMLYYILSGIVIGIITNVMIWKLYWSTNMRITKPNLLYIHLVLVGIFLVSLKYYKN